MFKGTILRSIFGAMHDKGQWRNWYSELYEYAMSQIWLYILKLTD
jgi:hypothetical protein